MGGEPKVALNVMAVPEDMPSEVVHEILRGGYDKVYEAGANIVGGHSIYDSEPKYGLAVSGFTDPEMVAVAAESDCGCIVMHWNKDGLGARVERKQVQLEQLHCQ